MDDNLIAHVCRACGDTRSTHHIPDACFRCGSRFDRGDAVALIRLDLCVSTRDGALKASAKYSVDFLGTWSAEERADVLGAVGQHDTPKATSATLPSSEKTNASTKE